jgi:4-hydroxymandelate oxidase
MSTPSEASVRDYYEGGSGEETTLRENELAWQALRFRPRVLRDVSAVSTSVELLGTRLPTPIGVAPSALHGLAHEQGEVATRRGAADAGALMVASMRASVPLERIGAAATGPWWQQVYAMRDRDLTLELTARAAAAGASALVLTGDTPVVGGKKRASPGLDVAALHLEHLRAWTGRALTAADVAQDPGVDLRFVREMEAASGLPVLVKGVLRADDALACVDAGAAGLIVSNHGGRQLDRAVPTALALPGVAAAVRGQVPVLVDGGLRSGLDVLAALALGAQAVLVGRPVLRALAAGAAAVTDALAGLRDELETAMRLAGATDLSEVGRDLIHGA